MFKRRSHSIQDSVQMSVTSFRCRSNIQDLSVQKSPIICRSQGYAGKCAIKRVSRQATTDGPYHRA